MSVLLENNEVIFGKNETTIPRRKCCLDEMVSETPANLIQNSDQGGAQLQKIFGMKPFAFPKHTSLIKYLLGFVNDKDAVILDFFAGSGTTGHAVMDMNKEDGGNRQFILCTNNENNICEEVCYQRLIKVNDQNNYHSNLEYSKIEMSRIRPIVKDQ